MTAAEPRLTPGLIRKQVRRSYTTHVRELMLHLWDALTTSRGDSLKGEGS